MFVTLALFAQLAASCGQTVNINTLAAVAQTESGFQSDAINDNTTGRRYLLEHAAAVALATDLVGRRHSVDLGLMQVNSANLPGLGMSVADALDPCKSVGAGARVLVAFYQAPPAGGDVQPAVLRAISGYNTGSPDRGFLNGYVRRVQASAAEIVPAIRPDGVAVPPGGPTPAEALPAPPAAPEPPSWDVYAQAHAARARLQGEAHHKPPVPPLAAEPTPAPAQAEPVKLQAIQASDAH